MTHRFPDDQKTLARFQAVIQSQHWSASFISDLLNAHDGSSGIDFRAAEQLLSAEKNQFERDLATARRMLRLYRKELPAGA